MGKGGDGMGRYGGVVKEDGETRHRYDSLITQREDQREVEARQRRPKNIYIHAKMTTPYAYIKPFTYRIALFQANSVTLV